VVVAAGLLHENGMRRAPAAAELVALVAALMSLNALAIDVMLPALPAIGADLGVADGNQRQLVVVAFAFGMGAGQLVFGPLSDAYGRKPVILLSLALYAAFGVGCAIPGSFSQLVGFRFAQGLASSGGRVIASSLVRDLYRGDGMARIMSLVVVVFMAVPILAPSVGWLILQFGSWRIIFWTLVAFSTAVGLWVSLRLPETHPPERRRPLAIRRNLSAYLEVLRHPDSRRYTVASGFVFGCLFAFISSSEQVFAVYDRQHSFPLYFAGVASTMAVAAYFNSRWVDRWGAQRVSTQAVRAFVLVQVAFVGVLTVGLDGFIAVYASLLASFFCVGLMGANFNALALEPQGHIAGTASAAIGFASTALASVLGGWVGQRFDGTAFPLALGFLVLATLAWVCVDWGRAQPAPTLREPRSPEPVSIQ
jgi:DHA1 family bicyclomycin/chloramphenicol resistance-like MFS transporter